MFALQGKCMLHNLKRVEGFVKTGSGAVGRWRDLLLLCTAQPVKHFNGRVRPCCTETNDLGGIEEARGSVTSMDVARRKGGGGGVWIKMGLLTVWR
jgi:hypothetical protein